MRVRRFRRTWFEKVVDVFFRAHRKIFGECKKPFVWTENFILSLARVGLIHETRMNEDYSISIRYSSMIYGVPPSSRTVMPAEPAYNILKRLACLEVPGDEYYLTKLLYEKEGFLDGILTEKKVPNTQEWQWKNDSKKWTVRRINKLLKNNQLAFLSKWSGERLYFLYDINDGFDPRSFEHVIYPDAPAYKMLMELSGITEEKEYYCFSEKKIRRV